MKTDNELINILNYSKQECLNFLKNNYGLRGINGTGLTRDEKNRTLENMRIECASQYLHNVKEIKTQHENR